MPAAIPIVIEAYGKTDTGRVRENNEDQFLVANMHRSLIIEGTSLPHPDQCRLDGKLQGTLLLVADGMGGESAGDKASRLVVESLIDYVLNAMPWFYRLNLKHTSDLENVLRQGVQACEASIHSYQALHAKEGRMGTTLTMCYILWPNVYIVHAGDSRCYLLRNGQLQQLTRDHTVAQLMYDQGKTTIPDEQHYGHVLWNAVGADIDTPVNPQITTQELTFGDRLLLCSDGLYGVVEETKIQQLLQTPICAEDACNLLIEEANNSGGEDNITTVVAYFNEGGKDDEPTTIS